MQLSDIASIRLNSQQLLESNHQSPTELVRWMGAVQAQDYAMVQWALGIRLNNSTNQQLISDAINSGEIIRTHVMRPTWHLITADDIYWMLELTAPQIKSSLRSRHKQLGLSDKLVTKSHTIITQTIASKGQATRDELVEELLKAGFERSDNRHAHLLILAELDALICSGKSQGKKQTYALLEERVPEKKLLARDEALAELADRYFTSHCPATLKDFVWWSGLYVKDAKKAIELISNKLITEALEDQTYYIHHSYKEVAQPENEVHLLPAFDEFVISYKDRSASIAFEHHKKAISQNGIFWPIIMVNGQIIGTWKRTIKQDKVEIATSFFNSASKQIRNAVEEKAHAFGNFMRKQTSVRHAQDKK